MSYPELIDLSQLAQELGVLKSKLQYYTTLGLFKPVTTLGGTNAYDKQRTIDAYKFIQKRQGEGINIAQIKEELEKEE